MSPKDVAARLVERVKKLEPGAEVSARSSGGTFSHVRYAMNELTTAGDTDRGSTSLVVALGRRHAEARTNRLDDDGLEQLAARAVTMARLSPEDPEWVPVVDAQPSSPGHALHARQPDRAHDGPTALWSADRRAEIAKTGVAAAKASGVLGAGFFSSYAIESALATSAGFAGSHRATRVMFSSTARSEDRTGSGWAAADAVRAADLDALTVARRAAEKAVQSQRPRELEPGRYTVVLEPACVALLVGFLRDAMDARAADEGRSYFAKPGGGTRVGERVLAKGLTLKSDPFDAATPAAFFDADGLVLQPTTWIADGDLRELPRSRYWAKHRGGTATGRHAVFSLTGSTAAPTTTEDLVAKVDKGLLVTRLWYVRWLEQKTMTVTGLTRDGVFAIEKGKIVGPVANFRFNDSPARVLGSATAWTTESVRVAGWSQDDVVRAPAILAPEFVMASKSAAV